jgi:hypothetical protein
MQTSGIGRGYHTTPLYGRLPQKPQRQQRNIMDIVFFPHQSLLNVLDAAKIT